MTINTQHIDALLTTEALFKLFPMERADQFFDALLGDAGEGAYDIRLTYERCQAKQLHFCLELTQRPGKCLACHLTYGLPTVFSRHPIINIKGLVDQIDTLIQNHARCGSWTLGATREVTPQLHVVPLVIELM